MVIAGWVVVRFHCLSKVANVVLRPRINQIQTKLIRPKVLYTPSQYYNGNQVDWLVNSLDQISIKYFHCFHAPKVMFWPANVHFIYNAVNLTFQSILICKYIVNICLKMFQTNCQRLSDQIRRTLKTQIFAPLEISRGPPLEISSTWKYPGGLAVATPWKFPGPEYFQVLKISRLYKSLCPVKIKKRF